VDRAFGDDQECQQVPHIAKRSMNRNLQPELFTMTYVSSAIRLSRQFYLLIIIAIKTICGIIGCCDTLISLVVVSLERR